MAAPTQAVDGEKNLVPRQIGTVTGDLFEIAGTGSLDEVDHLILHGWMLCHASPFKETECAAGGKAVHGRCHRMVCKGTPS